MTNKPDVSVVIPMHNASATITEVVESFLAIEGSAVEVIVVDDASTDDSVERVTGLGRPEVVVERFTSNRGAGSPGTMASAGQRAVHALLRRGRRDPPGGPRLGDRALDDTGADVAMMPYRYRRGGSPTPRR